jgi:hypothetical protein
MSTLWGIITFGGILVCFFGCRYHLLFCFFGLFYYYPITFSPSTDKCKTSFTYLHSLTLSGSRRQDASSEIECGSVGVFGGLSGTDHVSIIQAWRASPLLSPLGRGFY